MEQNKMNIWVLLLIIAAFVAMFFIINMYNCHIRRLDKRISKLSNELNALGIVVLADELENAAASTPDNSTTTPTTSAPASGTSTSTTTAS